MIALQGLSSATLMAAPLFAATGASSAFYEQVLGGLEAGSKVERYEALQVLAEATAGSVELQELRFQLGEEIALLSDESLPSVNRPLISALRNVGPTLEPLLEGFAQGHYLDQGMRDGHASRSAGTTRESYSSVGAVPDVIQQFGKIVHALRQEKSGAASLFGHWVFQVDRPGRQQETHSIHDTEKEAERLVSRMITQGLLARCAAIPRRLVPQHSRRERSPIESGGFLYWLVSRDGGNSVTRILESDRKVPDARKRLQFYIGDGIGGDNEKLHAVDLAKLMREHFGQNVTMGDWLAAFHVDTPGFRVKKVFIQGRDDGGINISGIIETDEGESIGTFSRTLPSPPEPGEDWVVEGNGFNIPDPDYQQKEIGRKMTQRFLAFLHHLGVDAFELSAGLRGAYAWPRMGFDFADEITRETMIIRFDQYLKDHDIYLSPHKKTELYGLQHAWELAEFKLEGRNVGEAFLVYHGIKQNRTYRVRFWVKANYPGWLKLFKGIYPPEWDDLTDAARGALLSHSAKFELLPEFFMSDQEYARQLHERINTWVFPLTLYFRMRERGQNHYSPDFIESLHKDLHYLCVILKWMLAEQRRGTELGRYFWQSMNPQVRVSLPVIVEAVERLREEGEDFEGFIDKVAAIPEHHPEEWDALEYKTRRFLIHEALGSGKFPHDETEHAQFLIKQLNRWMRSASQFIQRESQHELHTLTPEDLFRHYDSLYGVVDVLAMLRHSRNAANGLISEIEEQLDRSPRTKTRLAEMEPEIRRILGSNRA